MTIGRLSTYAFGLLSLSLSPLPQNAAGGSQPADAAPEILAWGDFDGDGRTDAFAVDAQGRDRLLRFERGELVDVSAAHLACTECRSAGATFVDVDADGALDGLERAHGRLVSAGPNGVLETPPDALAPGRSACGDDVVSYLRMADPRP